jgi:hypothetical protein
VYFLHNNKINFTFYLYPVMEKQLAMRIVILAPPHGIIYGLQNGSGNTYTTEQQQLSSGGNLIFTFTIGVKQGKHGQPDFKGPYVQGPAGERFVYIDIGSYAGKAHGIANGRLKIPLRDINWQMVDAGSIETQVEGTGKNGTVAYATPKPFAGWKVVG